MTTTVLRALVDQAERFTEDPRPMSTDEELDGPQWVHVMREWQPAIKALGWRKIEVRHAVCGLIRAGKVGALVAAGGTGKTTMLLVLAICHATGREFFGRAVMKGTFVLMSNDDPQDDLEMALELVEQAMQLTPEERAQVAQRVRIHSLQGHAGVCTFTAATGGSVHATGLEEFILEGVSGIRDLVGIAIDTLRQFSGGNSNDEQVIKLTITGATEIARRTGAYVILPHHTGKQNYRDGIADMYAGSGSAAIADNCRFVLLLQTTSWADIESKVQRTGQERGDPLVLLSTRGSLLMKPGEPIFIHRDGFYMGRVAGAAMTRDQIADERDRAVLNAVRRGSQSKNAIALAVGGKKKAALDRVDDLEARGLLRNGSPNGSQSRPQFVLTADGSRFLGGEE